MTDEHQRRIEAQKDDELTGPERQKTRYINNRILDDFVEPEEIKMRANQHDDLWWAFGWMTQIFRSWKKLAVVAVIGIFIGGEDLIQNVVAILRGLLP